MNATTENTDKTVALIAGCSHTAGFEIDGTEDSEHNRQHSWGNQLAHMLGMEPVNLAIGGASNPAIMRQVTDYLHRQDTVPQNFFVIIGWTECLRTELPSGWDVDVRDNNSAVHHFTHSILPFLQINPGWQGNTEYERDTLRYWHRHMVEWEDIFAVHSIQTALATQWYLESVRIPYVMCNTMWNWKLNRYTESYVNKIHQTRYYQYGNDAECFYDAMKPKYGENPLAQYGHLGVEAHTAQAQRLCQHIKQYNLTVY